MKEIKFRDWDNNEKKFYYFDLEKDEYPDSFWALHSAKPLSQFTGLLDKNGKKIWEGDIIIDKFRKEKGEVIWHGVSQIVKFPLGDIKKAHTLQYLHRLFEPEVIGNIYEKPELLKEGNRESH